MEENSYDEDPTELEEEAPCDYGVLSDIGCCFECWLYLEMFEESEKVKDEKEVKDLKYVRCPCCTAILEVDKKGFAREMEWWEMLVWSEMKETFEKLPPEIQAKIRELKQKK